MKRTFTASITHEGDWCVARCLVAEVEFGREVAVDVVSRDESRH